MTIHIWKTIICNWCTGRKEIYSSRFKKLAKKDGWIFDGKKHFCGKDCQESFNIAKK